MQILFDVTIEYKNAKRIIINNFADSTLKINENFRALCMGEKRNKKI